jgi:hypothetical protein
MKSEPKASECTWITHLTHKREFENSNLENFPNPYLKIQMEKTKFKFFSFVLLTYR